MTYHNTTSLTGSELAHCQLVAHTQEALILSFFLSPNWGNYSPSEVNKHVLPDAPITSVRRAMTGLTKAGLLVKTDELVDGPHGRKEGTWRLA